MPTKRKTKAEAAAAEETAVSQTELNAEQETAIGSEGLDETTENSADSQTEINNTETAQDDAEDSAASDEKSENVQTDTEKAEGELNSPDDGVKTADNLSISKTETENTEMPGLQESLDENTSESDSETEDPAVPEGTTRRTRHRRTQSIIRQGIVAIDDVRTVETEADKERSDLLDLIESQKSGRILTGTIQGVERSDNKLNSLAVLYHGSFKILIPAEETVEKQEDTRGYPPEDIMYQKLVKRLGAEVDYVIKGIDADAKVAVASRLEAMSAKRKRYYFARNAEDEYVIRPGIRAEARVVSVIRGGVFIDLFGVEVYIQLRELSYQRWLDATGHFHPGQRILVKILEVDRINRDNIKVVASVKQASENPYERALRMYSIGNRYVGTVSMVDTTGVFVALEEGIDCLCSYPKRGRPPRGARVTVRILGINYETNRVWGAIVHIAAAR